MSEVESASDLLRDADRHIFHRDVARAYLVAVDGSGARFADGSGRTFLDGSSGSYVCNIGHGQRSIALAIATQASRIAFTNTRNFTSEPELKVARSLAQRAPMAAARVWLCSSGTAANEAAVKMAYQYHAMRGNPQKMQVISRWRSYHGSSVGSLSLTGDLYKRQVFEPILVDRPHVEPPYCFRCPWKKKPESCSLECASAVEAEILRVGPENVSAIITEPYSGAPLGSLRVPDGYFKHLREICDRHDVLLIVDEVVSGMGRTGTWFATSQFGAEPDLVTLGKGLAGGMSPVGALLVNQRVHAEFAERQRSFVHYETFTGHALSAAAAQAVVEFLESNGLVDRVARDGPLLKAELEKLYELPIVGDVRGQGFLWAIELVRPDGTQEPFPSELRMGDKVVDLALDRGLLLISGRGAADGVKGDTVVLAPPYVATEDELREMIFLLRAALLDATDALALSAQST